MEFGIPKEVRDLEKRVGLTPAGVLALTQAGHNVYVERNAGEGAGFSDEDYRQAGAQIVYSAAEAYGRADVVAKVTRPAEADRRIFRPEQIVCSFLHLTVSSPALFETLANKHITAIAYEMIQEEDKTLPVQLPLSQVAGRMAPVIAGQLLMNSGGGRGMLLGGVPGVPPATVVILGGGTLGSNAARSFLGLGAQVTVIDRNRAKLQHLDDMFGGRITTMFANEFNLKRAVAFANVLIGSVHISGHRSPVLVNRNMVRTMRPGSVIIDFSIDNGGCVETSRPTTLRDQTYVEEGIIHHCVPYMTALVARTASHTLTNAALPYLLAIGAHGLPEALTIQPALTHGVAMFHGALSSRDLAATLGRAVEVALPGSN